MSSRPDCIFEIHQLWQSGFSRVYSNCCCSCWFEPEIIKIGQSSQKMYSNNILNFQESSTILNTCTKKSANILNAPRNFLSIYLSINLSIYHFNILCCRFWQNCFGHVQHLVDFFLLWNCEWFSRISFKNVLVTKTNTTAQDHTRLEWKFYFWSIKNAQTKWC